MEDIFYKNLLKSIAEKERQLAILIDPDKFNSSETDSLDRESQTTIKKLSQTTMSVV